MIAVIIYWNTQSDGSKAIFDGKSWRDTQDPISVYGPFESLDAASSWMENDYPEDDTDVYDMEAGEYDIPKFWYVNHPASIHGDIPDEDIRTDSQEIHAP